MDDATERPGVIGALLGLAATIAIAVPGPGGSATPGGRSAEELRGVVSKGMRAGTPERAASGAALVELFMLDDPSAKKLAEHFLALGYPGVDDPAIALLLGLGKLHDAPSLAVLTGALGSKNDYVAQMAAHALTERPEQKAEQVLIEAFLRPETEGDAWGTIRNALETRTSLPAMRALLRYGAERRDVRDEVSAAMRGWLASDRAGATAKLEQLATETEPRVARLARGFLDRCD